MKKSTKKSSRKATAFKGRTRLAAIDLGSNGIRLVICELLRNSHLRTVLSLREGVRLGRDVFRDGYIREPTARKVLRAFIKFHKIAKSMGATRIRAVATSAVRDSINGKQFVKYLREKSLIHLEVISGEREGRLIHMAISSKMNLMNKVALLIDVGGGSVELTVSRFGRVEAVETFPMGTVRMVNETDMILEGSKSSLIQKKLQNFTPQISKFLKHLRGAKKIDVIGSGGNIEALGELKEFLGRKEKDQLTLAELKKIIKFIDGFSYDERITKLKLRSDRADVILPGALALLMVMKLARAQKVLIPRVGLKDGVIIDMARAIE